MATATERELAEAALERNGLLDYFEFIITNTDVGKGKDDPAIFETATALLNSCNISENYSATKAADFCSGDREVNDGDSAVTGREGNANGEETAVIKKEETMIVEDSLIAIRTAVSAGFKACGVYDENEDILFPKIKETASITVKSLEELPDLVR
jgi:FMN phosphatase YigB (HAD superfamily)